MKPLIPFVFATSLAAFPVQAAEVSIAATGPVVELTVIEQVEADPDLVTVGAGVTTEAPTAVEALRENSRQMRAVIERIKSLGVAERDIQTTGINLNARYDYDQARRQQVFRGYMVSNRVSVKLRAIEETGEVLDALVAAGATDLSGPRFSLENDDEAKAEARRRALQRARAQAGSYAALEGYSDLRLLEINETISGRGAPPQIMVTASRLDIAEEAAPVQPGRVAASVSITVKYEMVR